MNKILFCIFFSLLFFSCRKEDSFYEENLKNELTNFDNLLKYIERNYSDELSSNENIVFADCTNESFKYYKTVICDSKDVQEKMIRLNIIEITFEKYSDNCIGFKGFNQVNFKLKKGNLDSTIYYRYEYCGTTKKYLSNSIKYIPVNKNWSVFVDSNF